MQHGRTTPAVGGGFFSPPRSREGAPLAHPFHTRINTQIPGDYRSLSIDQREQKLDSIFSAFAAPPAEIPGATRDPGVGWIVVVDAPQFASFVDRMGGQAGPLWRIYDIEVLPLNNDRTTEDIYDQM